MVYQRTLNKIEELKERPHHERRQVAAAVALGVIAVLFVGWGLSFFIGGGSSPAVTSGTAYPNDVQDEVSTTTGAKVRVQNESSAAGAASGYVQLDDEGYQVVPASQ